MNDDAVSGRLWHATHGQGQYRVEARGILIGNELMVAVYGGTKPHIGAVAIAIPRPSLQDPNITSATSSVFTLVGHKDDVIARRVAEELASSLNRIVVVVAGVHIDDATDTDVERLIAASNECVRSFLCQVHPFLAEGRAQSRASLLSLKHSPLCPRQGE